MNLPWKKRTLSVLGLAFHGRSLEAASLRQNGAGCKLGGFARKELSLDPLSDDPQLAGREIRDFLDQAELRERHCVVGVPVEWVLTHLVKLPDVGEEDLKGFIDLQAERAFPFGVEDLSVSVSRFDGDEGDRHALLTAIPRKHLRSLEKTLTAAGLRPVGFTLGVEALHSIQADASEPAMILSIDEDKVTFVGMSGQGIACLRVLNDVYEEDGADRVLNSHTVGRELRITLGQLPASMRQSVKRLVFYGDSPEVSRMIEDLRPRAEALGLRVSQLPPADVGDGPVKVPISGGIPFAVALAAGRLACPETGLEFLPPRPSPWMKLVERMGARKLGTAGAIAGGVLFLVITAFVWQGVVLAGLKSDWKAIEPQVTHLETLNKKASRFRSWYDTSQPNLRLIQAMVEAFPENDDVTARILEIRDRGKVACSGVARDNQAMLAVLEKLRQYPQVTQLEVQSMRGRAPIQFSFNFVWKEGGQG